MTEFQRYLAEEIAEDHADGLVSRREALRRLGLLGLSGADGRVSARGIVAGEARAQDACRVAAPGGRPSAARGLETAALPTREIVFRGPQGRRLMGAWAAAPASWRCAGDPREPRAQRLDPPVAGRLAASGYSALAIDLFSEEGGTGSFADEFEAMAALGAAPPRDSWPT